MVQTSHLGQGMVEYALVLIFVSVIAIAVLSVLGSAIGNLFSNIAANI
ncbi:MAG: hypothetical protein HW373_1278 [Deltaproteobacteria bacterium]|nr:hypothetical protein [Deltaproteobacteria bacterium]